MTLLSFYNVGGPVVVNKTQSVEIFYVIFSVLLFKKSFVKAKRPVVLVLRPVQIVLEGVARSQSEHQPQRLVARVSAHLFSPLHLHTLDDGSGPKLAENF